MPNPSIDCYGNKRWFKEGSDTILHREDGPAYEGADGTKHWYINNQLHRVGSPAIFSPDGSVYYCKMGLLHREDGPAIIYCDGSSVYYIDGEPYEEAEYKQRTKYVGRVFKKTFIKCRGCGNKSEWIVGTSKKSFTCVSCRSL